MQSARWLAALAALVLGGTYAAQIRILPNSLGRQNGHKERQSSSRSGSQCVSLTVYWLHHWLLMYTEMPPPLDFAGLLSRSARTIVKPSSSTLASGMSWHSHVSVNTMMLDSLYSWQNLL